MAKEVKKQEKVAKKDALSEIQMLVLSAMRAGKAYSAAGVADLTNLVPVGAAAVLRGLVKRGSVTKSVDEFGNARYTKVAKERKGAVEKVANALPPVKPKREGANWKPTTSA